MRIKMKDEALEMKEAVWKSKIGFQISTYKCSKVTSIMLVLIDMLAKNI